MNYADSEKINLILLQSWFKKTYDWKEADLILFNTCSVRQKWEDRVFWLMKDIIKERKNNNSAKLIIWITWCMVRKTWLNKFYLEEDIKRNSVKKIEYISSKEWIFNNDDKLFPRLSELDFTLRIEDIKYLNFILSHIYSEKIGLDHKFDDYLKTKQLRENPSQASIIIQKWCDNFCSFCIVPYTRGREISRTKDDILNEIKEAVKWWAKEITLLGQNVNSYWKQFLKSAWNEEKLKWSDSIWKSPFRELLEEIDKIKWIDRIRFTSSNPHDMTQDILDAHFDLNNTCNYLHFALQSWSNEMLKKMNRKHTYEDFKKMVNYLREKDPLFSISTDIIVWYSGETEEMFSETLQAMKELVFDFVYIARYSVRPWTIWAKLYPDDIPEEEKARRWHLLNEQLKENVKIRWEMMIGREEEVLVSWIKDWYYFWRTRNFKEVFFKTDKQIKIWDLVSVKIKKLDEWVLKWEIV